MSVLRNVIIAIAAISFITFVALFGQLPALRKTPIGWLQRALCIYVPNRLHDVDRAVTGGRITQHGKSLGSYLFYEKNPIVLILFLALLTGSATLFLWNATHLLSRTLLAPVLVLLPAPYIFTYLCAAHTSHYITSMNHADRLRDYPYDHILFRPHAECSTCKRSKPARSKHCSLCKACVAKSDHHCPWVNACLGRGNYRWFLALLLSIGLLEYYGAFLCWWLLRDELRLKSNVAFFSSAFIQDIMDTFTRAIQAGGLSIAGVGMLTMATALLPLGLLAYHLYLIWAGMTTNESQKWDDLRDDMNDGYAFGASRSEVRKHMAKLQKSGRFLGMTADEYDEPAATWSKSSDQILASTADGKPPTGQEHLWHRVWHLSHIDNVYDLGGWNNFVEVMKGR
ncbi:hypothetical protein AMS68_007849 [Peltaster fructicola]|uniref:Palmitoyltransferase n=1 Tax=Peltaster fructicola TaxID=286661 RepID=A0A6H0Y5L8_9PEZI|nr:hypothetical protein AMS68_007849 [Peltaster fructicola]